MPPQHLCGALHLVSYGIRKWRPNGSRRGGANQFSSLFAIGSNSVFALGWASHVILLLPVPTANPHLCHPLFTNAGNAYSVRERAYSHLARCNDQTQRACAAIQKSGCVLWIMSAAVFLCLLLPRATGHVPSHAMGGDIVCPQSLISFSPGSVRCLFSGPRPHAAMPAYVLSFEDFFGLTHLSICTSREYEHDSYLVYCIAKESAQRTDVNGTASFFFPILWTLQWGEDPPKRGGPLDPRVRAFARVRGVPGRWIVVRTRRVFGVVGQ
ncbi:hypothetical protein B0H16DRAFT_1452677 [Mycena metata]|uniref:Uncharacterized protein n=1 Tax=Mycena metata TaxID=1033252 RepID=A0AAD7JSS9_9AGAR|nr:hypothetical protein B0H16DRAFT_1452677 [Mycena metata]